MHTKLEYDVIHLAHVDQQDNKSHMYSMWIYLFDMCNTKVYDGPDGMLFPKPMHVMQF